MFKKTLFITLALMLAVSLSFAGTPQTRKYGIRFEDEGAAHATPPSGTADVYLNTDQLYIITDDGVVKGIGGSVRTLDLPLKTFTGVTDNYVLDFDSVPDLRKTTSGPVFTWEQGETSKIERVFRVPPWYWSTPKFIVGASQTVGNSSDAAIDFEVFVNQDGEPQDTVAWNQTPVALTDTEGIEVVELTVTSDFNNLVAGDIVTARFWRSNNGSVNGLRFHFLEFYGKPKY